MGGTLPPKLYHKTSLLESRFRDSYFSVFSKKTFTFRIYPTTSCFIRNHQKVDFTPRNPILFAFFYEKQGSTLSFFHPFRFWSKINIWYPGWVYAISFDRLYSICLFSEDVYVIQEKPNKRYKFKDHIFFSQVCR